MHTEAFILPFSPIRRESVILIHFFFMPLSSETVITITKTLILKLFYFHFFILGRICY